MIRKLWLLKHSENLVTFTNLHISIHLTNRSYYRVSELVTIVIWMYWVVRSAGNKF